VCLPARHWARQVLPAALAAAAAGVVRAGGCWPAGGTARAGEQAERWACVDTDRQIHICTHTQKLLCLFLLLCLDRCVDALTACLLTHAHAHGGICMHVERYFLQSDGCSWGLGKGLLRIKGNSSHP